MGHLSTQPYFLLFLTHLEVHTYLGGSAVNMMEGVTLQEPYSFFLREVFANPSTSLVSSEASKVSTAERLDTGQAAFRPRPEHGSRASPRQLLDGNLPSPRQEGRVLSVVQRVPSSRGHRRGKVGPNTLTISVSQAPSCLLSTLTTFLPLHPRTLSTMHGLVQT